MPTAAHHRNNHERKEGQNVVVCGAGIGGLTVAHELAKRGVNVTVFERQKIVGGLARSAYVQEGNRTYPVEYSWRVYGTGYDNLMRVLGEIPLRHEPNRTVRDRLIRVQTYIFPRVGKSALIFSPRLTECRKSPGFSVKDHLRILKKILFCATMSRRRMESLDNLTWKEFCHDLSDEANKYLVKMWGPVLGMDPTRMSFSVIAPFASLLLARYLGTASGVQLLDRPTNDGWFDEWTAHLESTGRVHIRTCMEVKDFHVADGHITGIDVRDHLTGKTATVQADYVVCGMGVEAIGRLVESNVSLAGCPSLKRTIQLAKLARQIQMSVQIFLSEAINYPVVESPILYLPDSPWALIIEPQEMVWGKTYCSDPAVKAVLSVGICQTDAPGLIHGKPFSSCTEQEIGDEVMAQMAIAYADAHILMEDGGALGRHYVVRWNMWDSFYFDETTGRMDTWEPKFSNNAGGASLMPPIVTEISNLLFATGYAQTDRFIYSMESAAEAGTRCANRILRNMEIEGSTPVYQFLPRRGLLAPIAWLDKIFFALGLPHPLVHSRHSSIRQKGLLLL